MSNIKGGGRAVLGDEMEQALVSLLIPLRHPDAETPSSDHERKREHKRFVKRLVERYERQKLSQKLNSNKSPSNANNICQQISASDSKATLLSKAADKSNNPQQTDPRAKVRVELVEAVYGKKGKQGKDFKEGTRKVFVFSKSTTASDMMKQAQSKLRMKKKPVRAFVVDKKLEMDLIGDLSGIQDGAILYITSHQPAKKPDVSAESSVPVKEVPTEVEEEDLLETVKKAYSQRRRRQRKSRPQRPISEHPNFTDHFDQLPVLSEERASLPAAACREEILQSVQDNRVVIICGATGCGKSTQVPQFLLEGMQASGLEANILVTQPRRVAAISLAQRVAMERDSPEPGRQGSTVGYNVRLDSAVSDEAKIVYCTVGILLRMLVCPKEKTSSKDEDQLIPLSNLSHIVIDEVHERDVNTDFSLTLLRALLRRNSNLRIILMSATAAANLFVDYFTRHLGKEPVVLNIPGRSFPVHVRWLGDCERFANTRVQKYQETLETRDESASSKVALSPRATDKIDNTFIRDLIGAIVNNQQAGGTLSTKNGGFRKEGAVLVFLPGRGEIEALARVLIEDSTLGNRDCCKILKLHSAVPRGEQKAVFEPAREGTIKVVLATNIAETSITIPDVSHVIDTGRVKESRFNSSTRIKELVTVWTSQASAKQRAGRGGRTSAGECWKLYSETFAHNHMLEQTTPEILRTPLDELILQVCLLYEQRRDEQTKESLSSFVKGACPVRFLGNTPEPPPDESLQEACKHLLEVDALRVVSREPLLYRLTPLGYHVSRLPMDAKVGKVLIVGCMLECLDNALTIAATLSCNKSCFFNRGSAADNAYKSAVQARENVVERTGFGGREWRGGTVKGDLIGAIAAYNEWSKRRNDNERAKFCRCHALDNVALKEIHFLRKQFMDCLVDAGFLNRGLEVYNRATDDALLTSCCLVAGLYPNICTLTRPRKGGPKGGRLLTKEGDVCRPESSSFQRHRTQNAAENGKDAYAVYHNKGRSLGTGSKPGEIFLSEVNFVSRFALLLFGGELAVNKNAIIVDNWLKFKIGDKGVAGAVLVLALRQELDHVALQHFLVGAEEEPNSQSLIRLVRQLLAGE